MRRSAVFFDAFLDGFTMAGFFGRLRIPGAPYVLFEAEVSSPSPGWPALVFERGRTNAATVEVAGDLRAIPDDALRVMIDVLKREEDTRKTSGSGVGQAGYASSR
jgi:hypothetical protein